MKDNLIRRGVIPHDLLLCSAGAGKRKQLIKCFWSVTSLVAFDISLIASWV